MAGNSAGRNCMLLALINVLILLLTVCRYLIIIQIVLSLLIAFNVINTSNDFVRSFVGGLDRITEPVYRPIRRILPDFGMIDLSPMVVLILISIIQMLLGGVANDLAFSYR